MRSKFIFLYLDSWFDEAEFKFIMKIAAQKSGCVFAYFFGSHKSNFRLQFRRSFKHDKSYKKKSSYIIKIEVQL